MIIRLSVILLGWWLAGLAFSADTATPEQAAIDKLPPQVKAALGKPIILNGDETLAEIASVMRKAARVNIIVDAPLSESTPDFPLAPLSGHSAEEQLRALVKQAGLKCLWQDGAIFLFSPESFDLGDTPAQALSPAQIESAIRGLSSDDYKTREAATAVLLAGGASVRAQMEQAARQSQDAEAVLRLNALIQRRPKRPLAVEDAAATTLLSHFTQRFSVRYDGESLEAVLEHLVLVVNRARILDRAPGDDTPLKLDCGPELKTARVVLDVEDMEIANLLRWVARLSGARLTARDNTLHFISAD